MTRIIVAPNVVGISSSTCSKKSTRLELCCAAVLRRKQAKCGWPYGRIQKRTLFLVSSWIGHLTLNFKMVVDLYSRRAGGKEIPAGDRRRPQSGCFSLNAEREERQTLEEGHRTTQKKDTHTPHPTHTHTHTRKHTQKVKAVSNHAVVRRKETASLARCKT